MNCPSCGAPLSGLEIHDNFGQDFEIDQCSACGGFWFDRNELYRVPIDLGLKIDPAMPRNIFSYNLNCPRDKEMLEEFSDPNLPSRIKFYRCPDCHGLFLSKGQLHLFKDFQKQKNIQNLELSRRAVRVSAIVAGFFFLVLLFALSGENIIKADTANYQIYRHALNYFQISTLLIFSGFVILCIGAFLLSRDYLSQKKRGNAK